MAIELFSGFLAEGKTFNLHELDFNNLLRTAFLTSLNGINFDFKMKNGYKYSEDQIQFFRKENKKMSSELLNRLGGLASIW